MPRTVRKVSPKSLENAALHYLGRFASSGENLRRILMRRVERSARFHDIDTDEAAAWVEALIGRFEKAEILDDTAYMEARVASLRRRGASSRGIMAKLRQKGLAAEAVVEVLKDEDDHSELAAAMALVKRRRLGPYRPEADRREMYAKDMAVLARAGFSLGVARKALASVDPV